MTPKIQDDPQSDAIITARDMTDKRNAISNPLLDLFNRFVMSRPTGINIHSIYIRFDRNQLSSGYITLFANGEFVGIRFLGFDKYCVEIGESFEGSQRVSGVVSYEQANRFLHENIRL